jgi:hypothetical protein
MSANIVAAILRLIVTLRGGPRYAALREEPQFHFQGSKSGRLVCGISAMRARTSASQACGSTSLSLAVWMSVYMRAARSAPRSDPANSHDFLPRAKPRRARSAALFERQILPSSRKRVKACQCEHVVDRLGDYIVPGEFGALGAHPAFERGDQRGAPLLAHGQATGGRQAVDLALNVKEPVDASDGLECDRRDRRGRLAPPGARRDVGKLEELPPRMAPAQRLDDRTGLAIGKIEAVVAVERIGLQNAGVTGQMPLWMLSRSIA